MINEAPLARFAPLAGGLVKPIYADYSFGNIPDTIEFLLTGEASRGPLLPPDCFGGSYPQPSKIVLVFVDSFGWHFWREHAHRFRATSRVAEQGTLTPISALFPSTTAASVSTLNLGVLPATSGTSTSRPTAR
jgi:predicted AlkP superfamily pyrophosphatase or phosphodiesterase